MLNLVNENFNEKVNYRINKENSYISCYLMDNNKVLIIGNADNNYAFWISITEVADKASNEEIFNTIAKCIDEGNYDNLASEYKVLSAHGITWEKTRDWYNFIFRPSPYPNTSWSTEFGHYYGSDQIEKNGFYFAKDVEALPAKLKERCFYREACGNYLKVLEFYDTVYDNLSGDRVQNYMEFKEIADILEKEKYLLCSNNEDVRTKYIELRRKASKLYNDYMTEVR